ncbi:MAG: hypothetical protein L0H26_12815, partial [Microlunatus sp.]|nr:hypothetical protein [Microlunatus sp.]
MPNLLRVRFTAKAATGRTSRSIRERRPEVVVPPPAAYVTDLSAAAQPERPARSVIRRAIAASAAPSSG